MATSAYIICPQCGVRRFSIIKGIERIVFMITRSGEIEIIKPEDFLLESYELDDEVQCLGCSWKGTFRKLLKTIR